MKRKLIVILASGAIAAAGAAWGHGENPSGKMPSPSLQMTEETAFGKAGDPKNARRTIRVDMDDHMRFAPNAVTIKNGETVRFVVSNKGKTLHEMVLGTMQQLKEHAELMKKHPGMEHSEPYMAHVPPGNTENIVWEFSKPGEFYYGCLIPGHFEAGMMGKIIVKP